MKIYAIDDRELMDISEIAREGRLLLRAEYLQHALTAKLTPAEAGRRSGCSTSETLFFLSLFFAGVDQRILQW